MPDDGYIFGIEQCDVPTSDAPRCGAGLALVPERRELFADMTIEDNLSLIVPSARGRWKRSMRSSYT